MQRAETAETDPAALRRSGKEEKEGQRSEDRSDRRTDPGHRYRRSIAAGLTVVKNTLDNVGRIELDPDLIGINPQVDSDLRNYRNIALLGIDARV